MNDDRSGLLAGAVVGGVTLALLGLTLMARRRPYEFQGKTVLITGSSRGLGLVLARQFAREGARVVICARSAADLERARQDLERRGAEVLAVPCDLTDREQVRELFARARERFGPVDVLINNAGVIQIGPLDVMTMDDFEEALKIHFWAPLYTTLEALPEMRARRQGRIVNISSIGGKISFPHLLPYAASKFALTGLSEGLRAELLEDGIAVTTVVPGLMRTGSPPRAFFKGKHRAEYAWFSIIDSLPLLSMRVERAARQIARACRAGKAEVVIGLPAQAAVLLHGLFPGAMADVLAAVNRLLPDPGGIGERRVLGRQSASRLAPSILTWLTQRAAEENNELG